MPRGGHFAPAEEPELLARDIAAFFALMVTAPSTAPGSKYEAITGMFVMNLKAGHYDAYVDLDVHDEVDEINKDNNRIFTTWYAAPRRPRAGVRPSRLS